MWSNRALKVGPGGVLSCVIYGSAVFLPASLFAPRLPHSLRDYVLCMLSPLDMGRSSAATHRVNNNCSHRLAVYIYASISTVASTVCVEAQQTKTAGHIENASARNVSQKHKFV